MIINELKEDMLYVHDETLEDRVAENLKEESYELPDGQMVNMGGDRIRFTESLFRENEREFPAFKGIHHMVLDSINKSDVDIRRDLFQNLILTGGNSHMKKMQERL